MLLVWNYDTRDFDLIGLFFSVDKSMEKNKQTNYLPVVLYYSMRCPHSINFLKALKRGNIVLQKINVDDKDENGNRHHSIKANGVHCVPSIILDAKVIYGIKLFNWLDNLVNNANGNTNGNANESDEEVSGFGDECYDYIDKSDAIETQDYYSSDEESSGNRGKDIEKSYQALLKEREL